MAFCEECCFIFNHCFDVSLLSYGENYDNTQTCSPAFQAYVESLVDYLVNERDVKGKNVVEVGCGKGLFLQSLCIKGGNRCFGFDPSYTGTSTLLDGAIVFERRFYNSDCVDIPADVVICRHVIEHVPKPNEILSSIKEALKNALRPRVYFETPCAKWILGNMVIWDFFYEHCSLFTIESLSKTLELSGFTNFKSKHVFGGQYIWFEAGLSNEFDYKRKYGCEELRKLVYEYTEKENLVIEFWKTRIKELRKTGPLAVWGAGAKGTTFVNLIDAERNFVDCVLDLNPNKQDKYIAGSAHPICGINELQRREIKSVVLMNPNYLEECRHLLKQYALEIELYIN